MEFESIYVCLASRWKPLNRVNMPAELLHNTYTIFHRSNSSPFYLHSPGTMPTLLALCVRTTKRASTRQPMHACLYEQSTPEKKIEDRALRNEVSFDRADGFDCCDYGAGCGYSDRLGDCDLLRRMVSEGDGSEMVKGSRQFLGSGGWELWCSK